MIPKIDERYKKIIEMISPKKEDKLLVIGTGVCPKIELFLYNKFNCKNITSGDIDKKNIENGKKVLPKINFIYLDAQEPFKFKNEFFDKVIITEVLEHLENPNFTLKEIFRVLNKQGKLILSIPKRRWFNVFSPVTWIQHKREYSENSIRRELENSNFKIEIMFVGGNIYELYNLWVHLIFKHIFKKLYVDSFFPKKIDNSYKQNLKNGGTDIIIRAKKWKK